MKTGMLPSAFLPREEAMEESPFDQLNIHLPGRMLVAEILLTLLLRRSSKAGQMLKQADDRLGQLEAALMEQGAHSDYALAVFAAARETLDEFVRNVGPRN
jgi:hypothetical protein